VLQAVARTGEAFRQLVENLCDARISCSAQRRFTSASTKNGFEIAPRDCALVIHTS
jgi:hypothetical protein